MARIRTIKPEFFTSEDIVSLSPLARILYIALWCEADKEGRMTWKPATFKLRYMPGDDCDIRALCAELVDRGLVKLYGEGLAYIPAFATHQHINPRESASQLPDPDASPRVATRQPHVSTGANPDMHAQVGREGKGREGNTRRDATDPTSGSPPPDEITEQPKSVPSMAGAVCVALKSIGMGQVAPGNQNLKDLLDAGADIGTFVEIGRECVANQKPFSYLLAKVKGRMADNAAIAAGATEPKTPATRMMAGVI